ncbi:MAG: histidinol-phosphate aminotransferase family protein [Coriobacteriia bacterium]|nr:histidinol-phosphate aminotransferase family protein [Coriobacteriia bacterium]MBS5477297.1 histidinol-phosphate aminotransferase family protein [Coriobacteriia bacterium]
MYGIRSVLLAQERGDYSEHLSEGAYELDCSMGSNPYGTPPLALPADVLSHLALYPHGDEELIGLIRERFAPILRIADDMIAFSCGSIGTCMALNRMCLEPGKTVVCMAPTFTAVTDDMVTYEPRFVRVSLRAERNFAFDVDDVLAAIEASPGAFVYFDNPNNPTGQVFPLTDVRRMAEAARAAGSLIVMDEAYGDYMADDQSALSLVEEFDNLVVVRTFSKGFGEAGVRLGYCVAQAPVMAAFHKVNIPFAKNSLANELACQSLRAGWAAKSRQRVLADKPRLLETLEDCAHLRVAHTDPGVSISMVYVDDPSVNLEHVFLQAGVRAVTCAGYDGLGANAVRLNLHENVELLCELVRKADALLA